MDDYNGKIWYILMYFTFSVMAALPINSLSCFPDEAVTAISFINLLNPLTPFTSRILLTFSLTVSAASKSLKG